MIPSSAPCRSSPISKAGKELLLGFGGAGEHRLQKFETHRCWDPLPLASVMDWRIRSTSMISRLGFKAGELAGVAQRGVADADAALTGLSSQELDHDLDFFGPELAK